MDKTDKTMEKKDERNELEAFPDAGSFDEVDGLMDDGNEDFEDLFAIEDDGDDFMEDPREGTPLHAVMKENGLLTLDGRSRYERYDRANRGCSQENPIVISATEGYVHLEYLVLERLLHPAPFRFVDFEVAEQMLVGSGGRHLDCLKVDVYTHPLISIGEDGEPFRPEREFLGTEEYWFDITAGFDAIAARLR